MKKRDTQERGCRRRSSSEKTIRLLDLVELLLEDAEKLVVVLEQHDARLRELEHRQDPERYMDGCRTGQ